ncbi:hypothetical protein V2J09_012041 [Rumex salicifolius]
MRNRSSMDSRVSVIAFVFLIFLSFFPGSILSAVVTLKSVKLYATSHTWTAKNPKVFFQCTGEKKTFLPDVVKAGVLYNFKGEESWQPVTDLQTKKCKRCGIYEDLIAPDHVFDEWELCSSNFDTADHHYTVFKEDEVIATFMCQECSSLTADPPPVKKSSKSDGGKSHSVILQLLIIVVVAVIVIGVPMALYKWWQKRKRQRQQARFMRLFDEDDDLDDELGLKDMR